MSKAKGQWSSQRTRSTRKNFDDVLQFHSQPGPSSRGKQSLQVITRRSRRGQSQDPQDIESENNSPQNMQNQEKMQIVSGVIKYLLMADRNKLPIQKSQITKNMQCNSKEYSSIMKEVESQLSTVFGYKLLTVEGNRYIMVNQISNHLLHLNFNKSTQMLLFLILVHIFMLGESCKEEMLWDFLRNLGIITKDNYTHEYFGDVKQLVTVDFVNQRYLEKIVANKEDPTKLEYKWGCRALNEITYRSTLEFVASIYGAPVSKWKLQYKAAKEQEQTETEES